MKWTWCHMEYLKVAKRVDPRSFLVARWVKDPALSLLWLELMLWCSDPQPEDFHMLWGLAKKRERVGSKCSLHKEENLLNLYRVMDLTKLTVVIISQYVRVRSPCRCPKTYRALCVNYISKMKKRERKKERKRERKKEPTSLHEKIQKTKQNKKNTSVFRFPNNFLAPLLLKDKQKQ